MTKAALSGNPLGTGTVTVRAPNTNLTRTLNLPDANGNLLVSGAPLEVPVGSVASPSVFPTGDAHTGLFFPSNDVLAIATGGFERLRVDNGGNVSMPFKPMFIGRPTTDYSTGGMPTGIMSITAIRNNGGHFNPANSRFTAPITGWYRTTWGGLQLSPAVTSLMVNGVRTHNGNHYSGTAPTYINMTQTSIEFLNAGDFLNIEQWNGGGYYSIWYLWTVEHIG